MLAAVAALMLAGSAPATSLTHLEKTVLAKIQRARASGRIDATTAAQARSEVARAAHLIRTLPNGRGYHIQVALTEVASFDDVLTKPRALELFGALRANDDYFAQHWAPADKTDIVGADGVVYRYFGGYCFRFHPLANFGVLNARATAGDADGTRELADALIERGVYQTGGGIAWEYDFPFGGGRAPWLSGMAQAVAAQAFARAASVVTDRATAYMREASAAYRVIPRKLLTSVAAGPWIRLYAIRRDAGAERRPAGNDLARGLCRLVRRQRGRRAREADAERGGHDVAAVRHGLLVVLRTSERAVASRLPDVRRIAAQEARAERSAVRCRGHTIRFLRAPATGVPARQRRRRPGAVLAVETGDGDRQQRPLGHRNGSRSSTAGTRSAGPTEERPACFRCTSSRPTGPGTRARSTRCRSCASAQPRRRPPRARRATPAQPAHPRSSWAPQLDDPAQSSPAQSLGLRLVRVGVAWPAGATAARSGPRGSSCEGAAPRSACSSS